MSRPGEVKSELQESKTVRDDTGFLNCNECPRRFFTEGGFRLHLKNYHKPDSGKELSLEEQQSIPQDSGILQKEKIDGKYKTFQCKENVTLIEHKSILPKQEKSVLKKLTPHQCQECKKFFGKKTQ